MIRQRNGPGVDARNVVGPIDETGAGHASSEHDTDALVSALHLVGILRARYLVRRLGTGGDE
jgi:hypothetical protein